MEEGNKIRKEDFSTMCCIKIQFIAKFYCLLVGVYDNFSNLNNIN